MKNFGLLFLLFWAIGWACAWGAIIYVAVHFIQKYW